MKEYLFDPQRWRQRAAELRAEADTTNILARRHMLLGLAQLYDGLAERSAMKRRERDEKA